MVKKNCWEHKDCGRQPGGKNVDELGVCPASVDDKAHGINSGKKGGRACWALAGTLCNGTIQAGFADKFPDCFHCSFYNMVLSEEGENFVPSVEIHELIENEYSVQLPPERTLKKDSQV